MTINFNLTGADRKPLVKAIEDKLETKAVYLKVPSCAYQIGFAKVDKFGTLSFEEGADESKIEMLVEALMEQGFEGTVELPADTPADETGNTYLAVSIPMDSLDLHARDNLAAIIRSKESLLKKALSADELPILYGQGEISFPWFKEDATPEESHAYIQLISALCEMARNLHRVSATEKAVENEKYAFRCFLLRLGFIGDEFKSDRKVLLKNFTGSSAFRSGAKKEYAPGCDPIPTPENTVTVDVEEAKRRLQDPQVQEEIKAILNGGDEE